MEFELLVAIVAVAMGQTTKGIAGFGGALVSLPIMFLAWPPLEAIFLVLCNDAVIGVYLAFNARRQAVWAVVPAMLVPAVIGQYFGTELLLWLPVQTTRIALATVVILYGLRVLLFAARPGHGQATAMPNQRVTVWAWAALSGLTAGLMAGSVGAGGPPVVAFVRRWFTDAVGRAVLICFFAPSAVALASMLAAKGAATQSALITAAMVLPVGIGAAVLGTWLSPRLGGPVFRRVVGGLLVASALTLWLT